MARVKLHYAPDYDKGCAVVNFTPELFEQNCNRYHPDLAIFAAAVLATATDRIGQLGHAKYLAPALYERLKMKDISLYSYGKCRYDKTKVRVENLGRRSKDFAFSISHRSLQGKKGEFELILITLRGTESLSESVREDFLGTYGKGRLTDWCGFRAYQPFADYAKKVLTGLFQYLKRNESKWNRRRKKYLITGHSLGGAAAQLLAAKLTDAGEEVFAYTFGSLNALTENGTGNYPNIWNIFNYYDTYGPQGKGAFGFRPAKGNRTVFHKFGNVLLFKQNYEKIFPGMKWSKNHVMPCYYHAVRNGLRNEG